MFNTTFLKKLTILYVEDEEIAKLKLAKSLGRLFKEVIQAANGEEALQLYHKALSNNQTIDLVLSDINMPKMNGIELLEKIREENKTIPFIFTTARSETEYLLKAIELNVNYYALKPIDLDDITLHIQSACEKQYYKEALSSKQKELSNFMHAVDNIAIVYRINTDGKFTFVNDNFLELTGYSQEEIKAITLSDILHPSNKEKYIKETWRHILTGKVWKGNTKYISKSGERFYLHITIFKIDETSDDDEFITLGFITTEESVKQREFHKKVMLNIKEQNLKAHQSKQIIEKQNETITQLKGYMEDIQNKLKELQEKNITNQKQLKYYENQLDKTQDQRTTSLQDANVKMKELNEKYYQIKRERDVYIKKTEKLEEQVENGANAMKKLYKNIDERDQRILELEDVVQYRESQILQVDPKLLSK